METLDSSESDASVKTGVVIGIFSNFEFFPKIYLLKKDQFTKIMLRTTIGGIKSCKYTNPVTSLKPAEPVNLSALPSTTINGSYFLTCESNQRIQ